MVEIIPHEKIGGDLKNLSALDRKIFFRIVDKKLSLDALSCSKPLRNSLKNHRAVRFGKNRIVFKIKNKNVYILSVGKKKEIYGEALKRV